MSEVSEPRRGLRKVYSWPDVVYTSLYFSERLKNSVYSLYLYYLNWCFAINKKWSENEEGRE